jgi:cytochrome c5
VHVRSLLLLSLLLLLGACRTVVPQPTARAAQFEVARASLASANQKQAAVSDDEVAAAFDSMLNACHASLSTFEARANNLHKWRRRVAILGAVVGGIAIPALTTASAAGNAVWISALGGVAGVTNAGQQAMVADGQTPAAVLEMRENVLTDWKAAIDGYYGEADPTKRLQFIQRGVAACTLYSVTISTNSPAAMQ